MSEVWYYHPESDCVFPSEPMEGDGLLVELGPVVEGTMLELLRYCRQYKINPNGVVIDRRLWAGKEPDKLLP